MTGFVERVDPMRTILRTDTCLPVMIPNKVLAHNASHIKGSCLYDVYTDLLTSILAGGN